MHFKNLSVAKKIWSLLLIVMAALLAAGLGMTSYMKGLETHLREDLLSVQERMQIVIELRGNVETSASFLVAANLAQDADSKAFFEGKFDQASRKTDELLERTQSKLSTEAGRALFQRIMEGRQKVNAAAQRISEERRYDGDVGALVKNDLVPAVQSLIGDLQEMVRLQTQLFTKTQEVGESQRSLAFSVGLAALAVVVLVGLVVGAWLVRQLTAPLAKAVDLAEAISDGDLTRNVHDERKDELGHLLRSLNTMTQKLRSVVGEVRNGVDSVSSAATQIASGNQDLSARTEQTAANLEETAASIEELTATATQSADTARQANQLAASAVQAAERGGEVVNQVVMSMDQINTSSRKISDIIGVIDGIAFQTNILALNAAVEAARAGEQGRGFAVVAGEVRSLAQRSAEAAKEIKGLITTSVNNVDVGAAQVAEAGESMQEIVASVRRVTDLIGEISASATEQRDGFAQVNQAVSNLDQMTQQNAALVEESSAAAVAMSDQAQRLAQVVAMFNVGNSLKDSLAVAMTQPQQPAIGASSESPKTTTKAVTAPAKTVRVKPSTELAQPSVITARKKTVSTAPSATPQNRTTHVNDDDWETF